MNLETIIESAEADPNCQFDPEIRACFRTLYQRLRFNTEGGAPPRIVGVTGCVRGDGVSTVASRLAIAAAEDGGQKVLLVDVNPPSFSVQRVLSAEPVAGLLDFLSGTCRLDEVLQPTSMKNLSVLPLGAARSKSSAIDYSPVVHDLLRSLATTYSFVVVDMAPADQLADDVGLMTAVDGVVLVVEAGATRRSSARAAAETLSHVRLLGAVLNKRTEPK